MSDTVPGIAPFDPERMITTLARHDVKYVLIGAVAARLQGFPRMTADADITPARDPDNLRRLAAALRELDAVFMPTRFPKGSRSTAARKRCPAPTCKI